ncbi:MAG: ATP-grasp domain-containing protein [Thermoplasmatales archaeon]|nr:ATP-grasp domain-containing protein [Thermoplasmatales archaeon]
MVKIGIIGQEKDIHVKLLKKRLEEKGEKTIVINFRDFPEKKKLFLTEKKIVYDNVNLMNIDVFYLRQLGYLFPIPPKEITKKEWNNKYKKYMDFVTNERETLSLKHSLIRMLDREKFVVNPYDSFMYHRLKPLQLYVFMKNNLPVPSFIAGNDLGKIKKGKMIYKALGGGIHTSLVNKKFIKENKETFKERPGLFQEYVKGKNIRVYAVGDEVIGAGELISGPQVDSRIEQKGVKVVSLPENVKEISIKAKNLLGMHFSGIDFMRTKKDEYYLLECNPSPMFYGFEYMTKIPVSKKLAEYLIKNVKR